MKDKLKKLLAAKEAQRNNLNKALIESDSKEERAEIGKTLEALAAEIEEVKGMLAEVDEPADQPADQPAEEEKKSENDERKMDVVGALQMRKESAKIKDRFDTVEYRKAFMSFCTKGTPIPAEYRADAVTNTSDASAVIPTTILNEIIKELKTYGNLYARVRKLNVQGGVNIPILSLKPVATWITANAGESESDTQKIQANSSVSFSYFGLECKVSQTLLANVTTLDMFQELFTELAVEAIAKALDLAIIAGTGADHNQPVGIINDTRVTAGQKVTISAADVKKWDKWKQQVFAKIKPSYRSGAFIMAQGTWDGYIDGMVDANGQPIGRVNYGIDGENAYRFGGKEVIIVENDIIKDFDSAAAGDVVVVYVDLKDYAINSNLEMQTVKWVDHDTNEIKNKVILICDGKLVDSNGVVIIKKGAASA